jgi:ABC-type polysaccharide/polyol phosphate transport system ATPase subunit
MGTAAIPVHVGENEPDAVRVEGVTKRYPFFTRRRDRALALLGWGSVLLHKTALESVSFSVRPGEAVGIVGENGSGKTTLLRLIAGISRPDSGVLTVADPVSAILELGMGFHPEFSGRENALLYGALVGVPETVMRDRLEEILAFAELGDFVDQPTRTYSSGMLARLAFAVATNVEPSVLVVDEALAVGDGAFQKKCVDRMRRFKLEGRAVLFCSHSMYLVGMFCDRAVWLRDGKVAAVGPAGEVIAAYETYLGGQRSTSGARLEREPARQPASIDGVVMVDRSGAPVSALEHGEDYDVHVTVSVFERDRPLHVGITLDDAAGQIVAGFSTLLDGEAALAGSGRWVIGLHLPSVPFIQGPLDLNAYLLDDSGLVIYSGMRVGPLAVAGRPWQPGVVLPRHEWAFRRESPP